MKPTYFKPSSNPKQFRVFPKDIKKAELKGIEQGRKDALNEIIEEIKKRDLYNFMGLCYSIKDIESGKGISLGKWLEKLKEKK